MASFLFKSRRSRTSDVSAAEETEKRYTKEPVDFQFSSEQISSLFCPYVEQDFKIIVDGQTYKANKSLVRTVFPRINERLNENEEIDLFVLNLSDPSFHFQLIQKLLAGFYITITEDNAYFLSTAASLLGCVSLEEACTPFLKRYEGEVLKKPTKLELIFHFISPFLNLFGWFGKIIIFLSELISLAITLAFAFNFYMLPITSGIISPTIPKAFVFTFMIPLLLFNFNVGNILSMAVYHLSNNNALREKLPLYKFYYLIRVFIRCFPFFRNHTETTFELEASIVPRKPKKSENNNYNTIIGSVVLLLSSFLLIDGAFRVFMICFVAYIPAINSLLIFVLYAIHAFLSMSQTARDIFIENADFSDPFLCSFYFSRNRFLEVIRATIQFCKGQMKFNDFAKIFFSKTTFSIYISVALTIFLIVTVNRFRAYQVISIFSLFFLVLIPLMSSICFKPFILKKLSTNPRSPHQLEEMKRWMHSDEQRISYLTEWLKWSRQALPLRASRIMFATFFFLTLLLALFPSIIAPPPKPQTHLNASEAISSLFSNTQLELKNPICDIRVGDLALDKFAALSLDVYYPTSQPALISEFFDEKVETVQEFTEKGYSRLYKVTQDDNARYILTFRGTSNSIDVMGDIELWSSSLFMNLLKVTVPIFSIYQDYARVFLGVCMNLPRVLFSPFSLIEHYISGFTQFTQKIRSPIILTGHSLGGGMAKIISCITGHQAVSFSGPGIQSLQGIGFIDANLPNTFINIVPRSDPVAGVDMAKGSDFYTPCGRGPVGCHSIVHTLCMIETMCGRYEEHYAWCKDQLGNDTALMENMWEIGQPYQYK